MSFVYRGLDLDAKKAYFEFVRQAKGLINLPKTKATLLMQTAHAPGNLIRLGSIKAKAESSLSAGKLRRKRSQTLSAKKERREPHTLSPLLRTSEQPRPKSRVLPHLRTKHKQDRESSLQLLIAQCEHALVRAKLEL